MPGVSQTHRGRGQDVSILKYMQEGDGFLLVANREKGSGTGNQLYVTIV